MTPRMPRRARVVDYNEPNFEDQENIYPWSGIDRDKNYRPERRQPLQPRVNSPQPKRRLVDIYDLDHFIQDCDRHHVPPPTLQDLLKTEAVSSERQSVRAIVSPNVRETVKTVMTDKETTNTLRKVNQEYVDPYLLVDSTEMPTFKDRLLAVSDRKPSRPEPQPREQPRGLPKFNLGQPRPPATEILINNTKRFKANDPNETIIAKKSSPLDVKSSNVSKPKFIVSDTTSPLSNERRSPLYPRKNFKTAPRFGSSPGLTDVISSNTSTPTPPPPPPLPKFSIPPSTPTRPSSSTQITLNTPEAIRINDLNSPSPVKMRQFEVRGGLLDFAQSLVNNLEDMVDLDGGLRYITTPNNSRVYTIQTITRWNRFTWFVTLTQQEEEDKVMECQLIDPKARVKLSQGMRVKLGAVYDIIELEKDHCCRVYTSWKVLKL